MGMGDDNYTVLQSKVWVWVHRSSRLSLGEARTSSTRWDIEEIGGIEVGGFCREDWFFRVSPDREIETQKKT